MKGGGCLFLQGGWGHVWEDRGGQRRGIYPQAGKVTVLELFT